LRCADQKKQCSRENGSRCRTDAQDSRTMNDTRLARDVQFPSKVTFDKRVDCVQSLSFFPARRTTFHMRTDQTAILLAQSVTKQRL
jgi:hypothetical protein